MKQMSEKHIERYLKLSANATGFGAFNTVDDFKDCHCDKVCEWKYDKKYTHLWKTGCGEMSKTKFRYCPSCGGEIKE